MDKILKKLQSDYNMIADHFSSKRRTIWGDIRPFLKYIKKNDKVLDIGCGNARLYQEIKNKKPQYLGIDFSQKLLNIAKKNNPQAKFRYGDLTKDKTWQGLKNYDIAWCLAVIHHLPSKDKQKQVIKKAYQALKPKGILVITAWNLWQPRYFPVHLKQITNKLKRKNLKHLNMPYKVNKNNKIIKTVNRFYYAFTSKELENLIKKQGFKIIKKQKGRNLCLAAKK